MSDRYYPEGHRTSNIFCVFSRLRATPCPTLAAAAKGKNVKRLECKSGHRPANTEPEVAARVSGRAVAAIRYPYDRRIVVTATATIHPIGTTIASCSILHTSQSTTPIRSRTYRRFQARWVLSSPLPVSCPLSLNHTRQHH